MERVILKNGKIKLTGNNGVEDIRTNRVYSVVITEENKEKYFKDAK